MAEIYCIVKIAVQPPVIMAKNITNGIIGIQAKPMVAIVDNIPTNKNIAIFCLLSIIIFIINAIYWKFIFLKVRGKLVTFFTPAPFLLYLKLKNNEGYFSPTSQLFANEYSALF